MVQILPFPGWRYDLSQVGALSEVTTPPVDALDSAQQHSLYRQHPCNVIRLVMNREEPGDQSADDRVTRAEDFWRMWRREGILIREHGAAFYVIQSFFETNGTPLNRWSVIGRMRLPDAVCQTPSSDAALAERVALRAACRAEFSPVTVLLGTEQESLDSLEDVLERSVRLMTPIEHIDEAGRHHRIWPVTDKAAQVSIEQSASHYSAIVTEGQTDFVAAQRYRDSLVQLGQGADPNDPAHFVLAWLVPAVGADENYRSIIYPILHAANVSARSVVSPESLQNGALTLQYVGNEPTACSDAAELAGLNEQQPCVAFGTSDGHWSLAAATDPETTCDELRDMLLALITGTAPKASAGAAIRTGHSPEGLTRLIAREFQKSVDQVLIVQPPRCAADRVLNHFMAHGPSSACVTIPDVSVASPAPVGIVFSSLESM